MYVHVSFGLSAVADVLANQNVAFKFARNPSRSALWIKFKTQIEFCTQLLGFFQIRLALIISITFLSEFCDPLFTGHVTQPNFGPKIGLKRP